uniref:Uncharacterized protein n=1 Tax=Panagrolaimus sp. PS1159 TaxID=55785 RepID=A0AC35FHL4_9BILA
MIYKYRNYIVFLFGLTIVYYSYETRYLSRNIYVTTTYAKHLEEWEKVPFCPALNESDWELLKELTTPNVMVQDWEREDLGIEDLGFVTYASFDHLTEAM